MLTHDSDFGTLARAQGQSCWGIVCLRPAHIKKDSMLESLQSLLAVELEIEPPFIVAAERTGSTVSLRLRRL